MSHLLLALAVAVMFGNSATAQEPRLGTAARQQFGTLMQEKASRTPAQRKISSQLLYEMKRRGGEPLFQAVPSLRTSAEVDRAGRTLVDIRAEVTVGLLRRIEALGGTVVSNFPQYRAIRARLPVMRLEALAQSPKVEFVRPASKPITNKIDTSEGDVAHRADLARTTFGIDGAGTFICVLSDSIEALARLQVSGDLPPGVFVLPGQRGSGTSEGTAMLEIIHDLAPGANLGFATGFAGEPSFASNIRGLRAAGCDVIVDDVTYFAEPVFQDGIVAQAVDFVVASGAAYFSAAGNRGNLNDGTAGVWEGDYSDSGVDFELGFTVGHLHDFGGGEISNQLLGDISSDRNVFLKWSDPIGASGNDYDLCILDSTLSEVFECSTDIQNGGADPIEEIGPAFAGERLVIVNFANSAAPRFLRLNTFQSSTGGTGPLAITTEGQTFGHSAAEGAFSVAAVDVATARGGAFTGGAANAVEDFSSDGPRRVYFEADGTAITPGNFLSTGGKVRQKPDIAAADGVMTATPDFEIFFGTSAAAPHAAAVAGLMLSLDPTLSPADIRAVFNATALDIEAPGVDRDSGVGIVDAFAALQSLSFKLVQGFVSVDHNWGEFGTVLSFVDPVIFAGPPTLHGTQQGVARVRNVTGSSFEARFQEWEYLDGGHAFEDIDILLLEAGRFTLSDGSIWEVGSFPLGGTAAWQAETFSQPFAASPALLLSMQTFNGFQAATVRARDVTANGFEAALFEEEALMDGHATEEVGYLAIHSPEGSGEIDVDGLSIPYLLQSPSVDQRLVPVLSAAVKLEEEQSQDAELGHLKETLSVLALGGRIFAQDVSSRGGDSAALRRLAPEYGAPIEWGTVVGVTQEWTTVPLAKSFANPVVVAKPVSAKGGQAGVVRVRNVTGRSFELRFQEWLYLDGTHIPERVFYLVAEAGTFNVGGLDVEAGRLNSGLLLSDGFETVDLSTAFLDPPAVFTGVMTANGFDPVVTRVDGLAASGFFLTMDEEEAKTDGHATETLGWIAVEQGSGRTGDRRDLAASQTTADHQPAVTPLGLSADRLFPVMVGDIVSTLGGDPVVLRYQNLTASSAELFLQEEQSLDAETTHTLEDVSLFAAE